MNKGLASQTVGHNPIWDHIINFFFVLKQIYDFLQVNADFLRERLEHTPECSRTLVLFGGHFW